jgi:hypothetical protein
MTRPKSPSLTAQELQTDLDKVEKRYKRFTTPEAKRALSTLAELLINWRDILRG